MKIGVMLRDIDNQKDAPGIIILNLLDELLEIDQTNQYILFYRNKSFIDRYTHYVNVKTKLVPASTKLLWDQIAVPLAARHENLDLLFHPKHSIPLLTKCKTLMHLRGSEYWVFPEHFERLDLIYQKLFLPIFCRKATHLIAESHYVKQDFHKILGTPEEKMTTIHLAPAKNFKVISDPKLLSHVRKKYNLPSDFFLTVTRIVQGGKYYPGKNLVNSIKAFQNSQARKSLKFVIVGRQTRRFVEELSGISEEIRKDIIALDFVPQKDLPLIYNLATFFLFPSIYESFGIPITEAMACGCPVITSTDYSCPETVGSAGILVNPESVAEIANAIDRMSCNTVLRENLRNRGFEEIKRFSWQDAAKKTLEVIERIT